MRRPTVPLEPQTEPAVASASAMHAPAETAALTTALSASQRLRSSSSLLRVTPVRFQQTSPVPLTSVRLMSG